MLNGDTYIGIHKGKAGTFAGTAFFKIIADNIGAIKLNLQGGSDAVLYSTGDGDTGGGGGVPEPATWSLMIMGIGLAGAAMRRKQQLTVRFA